MGKSKKALNSHNSGLSSERFTPVPELWQVRGDIPVVVEELAVHG